jgi:hypothetical protein
MPTPTREQLNNPVFVERFLDAIQKQPVGFGPWVTLDVFEPPPRFRKSREVRAQRARKLRRRGEYVHFVRWEHGHCIYSWGGPTPETVTFRMRPALRR